MRNKLTQKGFTLIELLIVIVIIGVLAAIIITVLNPARQRDRARDSVVIATMDKVSAEIQAFSNSDISGVGTYPTCAQLAGTGDCTATGGTEGTLKNIATCPCDGVTSFTVNGVTTGATLPGGKPAAPGFQYVDKSGSNPGSAYCLSAVANDQTAGTPYITLDYPVNPTPQRSATGCF